MFCDSGSSPLIVNCVLAADTAWDGGAVYCYKSSPVFRDCRIEGSVGWNVGGGMTCNEATPSLMSCTVVADSAYWGGGMYGMNSTINLIDCTIEANVRAQDGKLSRRTLHRRRRAGTSARTRLKSMRKTTQSVPAIITV